MKNILKIEHNRESQPNIYSRFMFEARKIIFGKDHELKLALAAFLGRGHVLIEDIPGMGKTTFVSCIAKILGLRMSRVQFTNDLLPSDILGASIYDPKTGEFRFSQGPIFAEIIMGDELNRASPKSQSAFLQAMEEHAVSIDGKLHELPNPFFIIATQNPHTQVGTHLLPESQLDRFLMKFSLGYPSRKFETEMLKGGSPRDNLDQLTSLFTKSELIKIQDQVKEIHISNVVVEYVQEILIRARVKSYPLSPRAGLQLIQAAKAWAFLSDRAFVIPEDIQDIAGPVLAHRIPRAEASTIQQLLTEIAVP